MLKISLTVSLNLLKKRKEKPLKHIIIFTIPYLGKKVLKSRLLFYCTLLSTHKSNEEKVTTLAHRPHCYMEKKKGSPSAATVCLLRRGNLGGDHMMPSRSVLSFDLHKQHGLSSGNFQVVLLDSLHWKCAHNKDEECSMCREGKCEEKKEC